LNQRSPDDAGSTRSQGAASSPTTLQTAVSRTWWVLLWERLWPPLASVAATIGLFLAVSWAGVWLVLPPLGRAIGVAALLGVAAFSAVPLLRLRLPSLQDCLRRLDRTSGLAHRPATAVADQIATSRDDQVGAALWQAHVARAREAVEGLRTGIPSPQLAARDPLALRAMVLLLLVATFAGSGGERWRRLAAAFDWEGVVAAVDFRVDAWVTPPAYTGRPPVILPGIHAGEPVQEPPPTAVPVGSTLVVRESGAPSFDVRASGGLERLKPDERSRVPSGSQEHRFAVRDAGNVRVRVGGADATWRFDAIPDHPPTIALAKDPEIEVRGSLLLSYKVEDDYGVIEARASFAGKDKHSAAQKQPRALYGPPDFPLVLPQSRVRSGIGQTIKDLTEHPWAGSDVVMTLIARDEGGNEGRSAPFELRLPERPFSKPLAKALVEQRRILALDADARPRVLTALDALSISPERFTPEPGIYLGLRAVRWALDEARSDDDLRTVVSRLWALAVGIEDGNLSETERALRAAQEALRQALERGANDEEIKKLADELRAALDKYLQALAEQQRNNSQQLARPLDPNTKVLRPQDLKSMLDRIENLARSGAKDAARQLLQELQSMLDNLQTAQPNAQPGDDDMMSTLDDLGDMIRKQQQLRDKTYRQGQVGSQRDRQQGRQQNPQADNNGNLEDLHQSQEDLRAQLRQLMEEMRRRGELGRQGQQGQQRQQGQGDKPGEGGKQGQEGKQGQGSPGGDDLGRAEQAMREAGEALGNGNAEGAVDAQGRALEALRKGAQSFAQQMGRQQGPGQQGRLGRSGQPRAQQQIDPLGRPMRGREYGDDTSVKVPGEIDVQRARRILEELRRRFADPQRPQLELDYLDRLLRDFQ
jgi:uncharacterized protein (TIGR02302 family)